MFGIFSHSFKTATRTSDWDAPQHWKLRRYPQSRHAIKRDEIEARQRAMRTAGMW